MLSSILGKWVVSSWRNWNSTDARALLLQPTLEYCRQTPDSDNELRSCWHFDKSDLFGDEDEYDPAIDWPPPMMAFPSESQRDWSPVELTRGRQARRRSESRERSRSRSRERDRDCARDRVVE